MKTVSRKSFLLFMGIAVFTAACCGLACFFFHTSGQMYFLVIALFVLLVGLSNITSKITARLAKSNDRYTEGAFRESIGSPVTIQNSNDEKRMTE